MKKKTVRKIADAAEARQAIQAVSKKPTTPVSEADLADVIDVGAVDDYVAVTGEYPMSSDLAEGELAEESLIEDVVGRDPALGDAEAERPLTPSARMGGGNVGTIG